MLSTKRFFGVIVPNIKAVSSVQLREQLLQQNVSLIDVRDRNDIEKEGKLKNAINIPFHLQQEDMFTAALSDVKKQTPVVFYSKSGRSSHEAAIIADKLGFQHIQHLEGGLKNWQDPPLQPFMNNHSPWVHPMLDTETETAQYIVTDLESKEAYIINPVLNYDPFSNQSHPLLAKSLLQFIETYQLQVSKIIDTQIHNDHLTAAEYLRENLLSKPEILNAKEESWTLGKNIHCSALATPGHTSASMSFKIGDAAFVGDTLLMPDIGTARCDTPDGNAEQLYESIHKMYKLWPDDTRIFVGHDYPPEARPYQLVASLENHKKFNTLINENITLQEFVIARKQKDASLKPARLIPSSIQMHLSNRGAMSSPPELSSDHKKIIQDLFKVSEKYTTTA